MKIQVGEVCMDKVTDQRIIYPNKTRKYILPCLKVYGDVFTNKISNVFKVAVGIGDIIVDRCGINYEKHIFVLLDPAIAHGFFLDFLDWIRDQEMYEDDYVYGNIQKATYHMIILRFPEKFWKQFDIFKEGKYSEMYDLETIKSFFQIYPNEQKVLIKDRNYRIVFTKKLNKEFGTTIQPEEWTGELDFPPTEKTDVFNHHLK